LTISEVINQYFKIRKEYADDYFNRKMKNKKAMKKFLEKN
jgi:hypothetical protein